MFRTARRRVLTAAGATAATVVVSGLAVSASLAFAAVDDGPVITACIDKKGTVRVVDSADLCGAGETVLKWNKEGPVGPAGAPGQNGANGLNGENGLAGAAGAAGPAGAPGKDGQDGQDGQDGRDGAPGPAGPKGDPGSPGKLAGGSGEFARSGQMTCTGTKQGKIGGDGPGGTSPTESTSYTVKSPRDAATGQASGKRQHGPFSVRRQLDKASPQLFQALVTGETLTSCVFSYYGTSGDGGLQEIYRITLNNASVSDISLAKGDTRLAGEGPLGEYESVSFTFQKITMLHVPSGTVAVDDWSSQI